MTFMHLVVPFAGALAEPGRAALRHLDLPQLRALLNRWAVTARDEGDEWSFTPPHERALARAFGWQGGDGRLPFAAWQAAADGLEPADLAWGLLTPSHWHLGTDQVSLIDPAGLMLDEAEARELFAAVAPLYSSEGFVMTYAAPSRWYLAHESLATLRSASLDRVIGRNVDRWLYEEDSGDAGGELALRLLRRLQNEVQMQLYTHPVNEAREVRGLLPVNSVWLSGCGPAQPAQAALKLDQRLRGPALADDWAAWARAWQTLDEGPIAALASEGGGPLTLCGERSSVTLAPAEGAWHRLRSLWSRPAPAELLETL
jgi:hypothetical protein